MTTYGEQESRATPEGGHLRPAYAHLVDLSEHGTGRAFAARKAAEIRRVIAQGGWTDTEARNLYEAVSIWDRRAEGHDARYLLAGGNRRGRLPRQLEDEVKTLQIAIDIGDAMDRLRDTLAS